MSKHYSNRYVGPQSTRGHVPYYNRVKGGKLIEILLCIPIGCVVVYLMAQMLLCNYKMLTSAIADFQEQQNIQTDVLDKILDS